MQLQPRILSVVWYKVLPARFGGQKGIAGFNQEIGKHFPLFCLCASANRGTGHESYTVLNQLPDSRRQFFNPLVWLRIIRTARKNKITHLVLEHPYHGIAAWLTCLLTGCTLIIHAHNIEFQRFRILKRKGWRILKAYEKWIFRKAALCLFKTEADQQEAIRSFHLTKSKTLCIPYAADAPVLPGRPAALDAIRSLHGIKPGQKILLFAGTLDYAPNAAAVEMIYRELAPLLRTLEPESGSSFTIVICGRNHDPAFAYLRNLQDTDVIQAGEVTDLHLYYAAADVFINPVQKGGGVQTKNLDAAMAGLPVAGFASCTDPVLANACPGRIISIEEETAAAFCKGILQAVQILPASATPSCLNHFTWAASCRPLIQQLSR